MGNVKNRERGAYILIFKLKKGQILQIGKLGKFFFPAGFYTYTGSALGGVKERVQRHLRRQKCLHWHIDYLLPFAEIIAVQVKFSNRKIECALNNFLICNSGAKTIVKKFGSSDCRCPTHLLFWEKANPLPQLHNLLKLDNFHSNMFYSPNP
ncbi:MAG: GIY-YIG nuclease family protein [Candidatus Sumerlaeia bacterium]|nr:GIY-YIG nuclease family protein [Candidatus Sumerlaeia bacterium]